VWLEPPSRNKNLIRSSNWSNDNSLCWIYEHYTPSKYTKYQPTRSLSDKIWHPFSTNGNRQIAYHALQYKRDERLKFQTIQKDNVKYYPKKSQPKKRWLIDSSFPQSPEHTNVPAGNTPRRSQLSFIGILLLKILQANNETFKETTLFQIKSKWISLWCCSVWITI
jgi:hypothetical protein